MKKFAFFLPQFHSIPENDLWWGEGFTEWSNVKKAVPLYEGHVQPKHPLDNNYYNLLDKKTVLWQTELMNKYQLDGFIYYHYYFEGKTLLEKPAENLLKWQDVPQRFFFCWANHSWIKSWKGSREILLEQKYGDLQDWELHFQYLLPFFNDVRYEKKDNKPIFMLFESNFDNKQEMLQFFNQRCKDEGFAGIYLINTFFGNLKYDQFQKEIPNVSSMTYFREPAWTSNIYYSGQNIIQVLQRKLKSFLRSKNLYNKPRVLNGNDLMKLKIANEPLQSNIAHGLWFEWDNTPRHKNRGYVITPYDRELFDDYMKKIKDEEFLFINAWNEWAEGMMLEPTKENGYKYLEWIKEWGD